MSVYQTSPQLSQDVMGASQQVTLRSVQVVMLCGTMVALAR